MRGVRLHYESWKELFDDEKHGCPLVPILILAHEHDPDPEMRPYKHNIDGELRDKLILGIAGAVTAIYRYFAPQRRMMAAAIATERTAFRQTERKIGRNDPMRFGQEIQTMLWASRSVMNAVLALSYTQLPCRSGSSYGYWHSE